MKKKLLKIAGITIGISLVAIMAVYFYKVNYYRARFVNGTIINGADVSDMAIADLEDSLNRYQLNIKELTADGEYITESIFGKDIDLRIENAEALEQILMSQNIWLWFQTSNQIGTKEYEVSYDEIALENAINELQCFHEDFMSRPIDARLSEYKKGVGYEVVKEKYGNIIHKEKAVESIEQAILSLHTEINLKENGCYQQPKVTADNEELIKAAEAFNQYTDIQITYEFGDKTEIIDGEIIHKWLSVDDTGIKLDEDAVLDYVTELKKQYDTIFRNREFKTSYGSTVIVEGGDYGWWMDYAQEAKELATQIRTVKSGTRTPVYFQTAGYYGDKDYGDTYVEINLSAQHMFFYKDGQLILESDFVSGKLSNGNQTPVGTYGITYKERDSTLVGENYATPVSYWMPFNKNIGMHDAPWRSEFGGSIYKGRGSHGCINMPPAAAAELFGYIEKGMPVFCYELPGTESS